MRKQRHRPLKSLSQVHKASEWMEVRATLRLPDSRIFSLSTSQSQKERRGCLQFISKRLPEQVCGQDCTTPCHSGLWCGGRRRCLPPLHGEPRESRPGQPVQLPLCLVLEQGVPVGPFFTFPGDLWSVFCLTSGV